MYGIALTLTIFFKLSPNLIPEISSALSILAPQSSHFFKVTSTEGFTVSEVLGAGKSEQEHRIHTAANTKARHKHTFFIMASPFIIYLVIFIYKKTISPFLLLQV